MSLNIISSYCIPAFLREPLDKTLYERTKKCFCDRSFKLIRTAFTYVEALIAKIILFVCKTLRKAPLVFCSKKLTLYRRALSSKARSLASRHLTLIKYRKELINFSSNRMPIDQKLLQTNVDQNQVFREIYKKEFKEVENRWRYLNRELQEERIKYIFYYTLSHLREFKLDGFCEGASLDFAQRYLKEIKKGTQPYEAVKKISLHFENYVSPKALVVHALNTRAMYMGGVNLYDDGWNKVEHDLYALKSLKRKIEKKKTLLRTNKEKLHEFEEELDVLTHKGIYASSRDYNYRKCLPKAHLFDLKVVDKCYVLALNKLSLIDSEFSFKKTRLKRFKKVLAALQNGVYNLGQESIKKSVGGHSMLLIKETDRFFFYEPNKGVFSFKSKVAAEKLLSFAEKYMLSKQKIITDPKKVEYLAITKLEQLKK